jgi:hypothetical protein
LRKLGPALVLLTAAAAACGKKGPPLAPLNLVPDRPPTLTARVVDGTVYLRTAVPTKNANGPGRVNIDHLGLFAVTVAARANPPANKDLLKPSHEIARVSVKPPPDPDAPLEDTEPPQKDERPAPGDAVSFTEALTPKATEPEITPATPPESEPRAAYVLEVPAAVTPTSPDAVPAGGASVGAGAGLPGGPPNGIDAAFVSELPQGDLTLPGSPAAPPRAPPPARLTVTSRIYVAAGVTRKGRTGTSSERLAVPLVPPPPPPVNPAVTFGEVALTVSWTPPAAPALPNTAASAPLEYNVYDANAAAPPKPLNPQPLDATTFDDPGLEPGTERCFVVRSVHVDGPVAIESAASASACVTPRDIFPPAAPKALAAVAGAGGINLIWDANAEPDLAGYLVLRGDAPNGTLQPLTPQPIRETRYVDATAQPGVQYVYVVVAVDKSGNRSGNSNMVTETAR